MFASFALVGIRADVDLSLQHLEGVLDPGLDELKLLLLRLEDL